MKYMRLQSLVVLGLGALLMGCPTVHESTSLADREPLRNLEGGDVLHSHSGTKFPESVAGFTRTGVRQYDRDGFNVRASYDLSSPRVAVTVFVYPTPPVRSFGSPPSVVEGARTMVAHGEFQRAKEEIIQAHTGAELVEETDVSPPEHAPGRNGHFARFRYTMDFAGHTHPVESLLYTYGFVSDRWTVKYRVTYPEEAKPTASIERFLRDIDWPGCRTS